MACGGCAKRAAMLASAGKALKNGDVAAAARRAQMAAQSAARDARLAAQRALQRTRLVGGRRT